MCVSVGLYSYLAWIVVNSCLNSDFLACLEAGLIITGLLLHEPPIDFGVHPFVACLLQIHPMFQLHFPCHHKTFEPGRSVTSWTNHISQHAALKVDFCKPDVDCDRFLGSLSCSENSFFFTLHQMHKSLQANGSDSYKNKKDPSVHSVQGQNATLT